MENPLLGATSSTVERGEYGGYVQPFDYVSGVCTIYLRQYAYESSTIGVCFEKWSEYSTGKII